MKPQAFNLNLRSDHPDEIWEKVGFAYTKLDGWLGFGDGISGENGIPYWFSFDMSKKYVLTSVEPSGLQFMGRMNEQEWARWKYKTKVIISHHIGLIVGEIEWGEVGSEVEPLT